MTMVKAAAKMGFHLPPHADKKYPPRPMTSALHVALKLCTAVSLVGALGLTYSSLSKQSAVRITRARAHARLTYPRGRPGVSGHDGRRSGVLGDVDMDAPAERGRCLVPTRVHAPVPV